MEAEGDITGSYTRGIFFETTTTKSSMATIKSIEVAVKVKFQNIT